MFGKSFSRAFLRFPGAGVAERVIEVQNMIKCSHSMEEEGSVIYVNSCALALSHVPSSLSPTVSQNENSQDWVEGTPVRLLWPSKKASVVSQ